MTKMFQKGGIVEPSKNTDNASIIGGEYYLNKEQFFNISKLMNNMTLEEIEKAWEELPKIELEDI